MSLHDRTISAFLFRCISGKPGTRSFLLFPQCVFDALRFLLLCNVDRIYCRPHNQTEDFPDILAVFHLRNSLQIGKIHQIPSSSPIKHSNFGGYHHDMVPMEKAGTFSRMPVLTATKPRISLPGPGCGPPGVRRSWLNSWANGWVDSWKHSETVKLQFFESTKLIPKWNSLIVTDFVAEIVIDGWYRR